MPLNARDASSIQSATRANVVNTLVGMRRFLQGPAWLGRTNRYSFNVVKKIDADLNVGGIRSSRHLAQYIAASGLLHCSDGWGYLGKAILSFLLGDPHRCRHFAYYAELRATMGLLATEGIGIFNHDHFVIKAPNQIGQLNNRAGTHQIAWNALEFWGQQPRSGNIFARVVRPYGLSLSRWLEPIDRAGVVWPQARKWFLQWGMDLKMLAKDRDARNESSYRVDGIPQTWRLVAPSAIEFARDLWTALEPAPNSNFDIIDRHILRLVLEGIFRGQTNREPAQEVEQFTGLVTQVISNQNIGEKLAAERVQFLTRNALAEDPSIFQMSAQRPDTRRGSSCESIIARGALLLRVASGATAALLQDAGITSPSIKFWWQSLGQDRGIWEGDRDYGTLMDLWADIEAKLEDIEEFQQNYSEQDRSFFKLSNQLGDVLVGLGSCERVAIWGMTP